MKILEENKITNVQPLPQCKGQRCEREATIEDPKGRFYCEECYSFFSYTRQEYWSNPDAKGHTEKR